MRKWVPIVIVTLSVSAGCQRTAAPPAPATADLPPAYPRALITDPRVAQAAQEFRDWVDQQKAGEQPVFGRVEILPPLPTLQPYGIGTYEKVPRLPAILTTGPGWATLPKERREALTAAAFTDLTERLAAISEEPPLRPTITIQTPQGLELAWVNSIIPGRRLLHGDGE